MPAALLLLLHQQKISFHILELKPNRSTEALLCGRILPLTWRVEITVRPKSFSDIALNQNRSIRFPILFCSSLSVPPVSMNRVDETHYRVAWQRHVIAQAWDGNACFSTQSDNSCFYSTEQASFEPPVLWLPPGHYRTRSGSFSAPVTLLEGLWIWTQGLEWESDLDLDCR